MTDVTKQTTGGELRERFAQIAREGTPNDFAQEFDAIRQWFAALSPAIAPAGDAVVYQATTRDQQSAYFGDWSAARAWAGNNGNVTMHTIRQPSLVHAAPQDECQAAIRGYAEIRDARHAAPQDGAWPRDVPRYSVTGIGQKERAAPQDGEADQMKEVLATMLGAAEADGLDLNSNEWRNHMIAAREVLGLPEQRGEADQPLGDDLYVYVEGEPCADGCCGGCHYKPAHEAAKINLVVSIGGGCLRAIHTDSDHEFDVQLFDWDSTEEDREEDQAAEARYDAVISTMKEIF